MNLTVRAKQTGRLSEKIKKLVLRDLLSKGLLKSLFTDISNK